MKKKLFLFAAGLGLAVGINAQTLYVPGGTGGIGNSTITGNVGIGISAPDRKLQVLGAIESATQSGSNRNAIQMFISSNYGGIDVFDHDDESGMKLILNESGGNVGIGTVTPAGKLSIRNGTYGGLLVTANNGAGWTTSYGKIQAGSYSWGDGSPSASNLALNPDGGNVGIGTTAPVYSLTIKGIQSGPQTLISYDGSNGIFFHSQGGSTHSNWLIGQQRTTSGLEFTPSTTVGGTTFSTPAMVLKVDGCVGIGTTNPQNMLDVNGTIRAHELKATLDNWSDYVFNDDYKLPSLNDVENYIKTNKHLQDIPSATEVTKEGVNIGEMNAKLLKKIEELTLYAIEQNKMNMLHSEEINLLKQEIAILKGRN